MADAGRFVALLDAVAGVPGAFRRLLEVDRGSVTISSRMAGGNRASSWLWSRTLGSVAAAPPVACWVAEPVPRMACALRARQ